LNAIGRSCKISGNYKKFLEIAVDNSNYCREITD